MDVEDTNDLERDESQSQQTSFATNARYAIFAKHLHIWVYDLRNHEQHTWQLLKQSPWPWLAPIVALSPSRLKLLAVAQGAQVQIYDLDSGALIHHLKGNGRVVTAIAFSNDDTIATGTVDGSVYVWSVQGSLQPLHRLAGLHAKIESLTFHPISGDSIAAIHGSRISLWRLRSTSIDAVGLLEHTGEAHLVWPSANVSQLLVATVDGALKTWKLHQILSISDNQCSSDNDGPRSSDSDDPAPVNCGNHLTAPTVYHFGLPMDQIQLVGFEVVAVFTRRTRTVSLLSLDSQTGDFENLWTLQTQEDTEAFAICSFDHLLEICTFAGGHMTRQEIPISVSNAVEWSMDIASKHSPSVAASGKPASEGNTMRPHRITASFEKREASELRLSATIAHETWRGRPTDDHEVDSQSQDLMHQSVTSSLELPTFSDDEAHSPMPFLSPGIPARRTSFGPTIDESLHLPPLASFDSMPSTAEPDSDSDDEAFAGPMNSSGTYLPGGVNVPLPRTCGASFTPSGQLLTFFPLHASRASAVNETETELNEEIGEHSSEAASLFPRFGNLIAIARPRRRRSDTGSLGTDGENPGNLPRFLIQSSSYEHMASWASKISPTKSAFPGLQAEHKKTNVSVLNIASLLMLSRKDLVQQYECFRDDTGALADLCRRNGDCAATVDLATISHCWNTLSLVLQQHFQRLHHVDNQARADAVRSPRLSLDTDGVSWAVRQLLDWAERRADIQTLASMSALLLGSLEAGNDDYFTTEPKNRHAADVIAVSHDLESVSTPPAVAVLRTDSGERININTSPEKLQGSRTSSRGPSQPTTPYLDSELSTSSLTLMTMSQGSRAPHSGSISPEHSRGSFSAAAKFYAQSITDKFASYGSSSPPKRAGTSPSTYDPPMSLPTGSLSKAVSFASTIDSLKPGPRSSGFVSDNDGYESDRTAEDTVRPLTPKGANTDVVKVTQFHEGQFFDEGATSHRGPLLPEDLWTKSSLWRQTHAQWLRSNDLLQEATELEKISLAEEAVEPHKESSILDAVVPQPASARKHATCSVCFCHVAGAEQLCLACLHVAHPSCLEDLILAIGIEEFTCPTGCGCKCAASSADEYDVDSSDDDSGLGERSSFV